MGVIRRELSAYLHKDQCKFAGDLPSHYREHPQWAA